MIIVAKIIIIDDDCDNCGKGEDNDNHDACDNCDHFFSLGVLVKLKIFERKHKRLSIFSSYHIISYYLFEFKMKKKVDELSRHGTQGTIQTNGTKLMILRSILNNDHYDDFDENLW